MNTENVTSLTIVEPASVTASGNPIVVTVSTGSDATQEAFYYCTITSNSPSNNSYITFDLTFPLEYDITYGANEDPLASNEFWTSAAQPTTSQNMDRVAQLIRNNKTLNQIYTVEKTSTTAIKVTSRLPGTMYDLTDVVTASGFTLAFSNFASVNVDGSEGQKITNLFFTCDFYIANNVDDDIITVPSDNLFIHQLQFQIPFIDSNEMVFDLQPVITAYLNKDKNNNITQIPFTNQLIKISDFSPNSLHWKAAIGTLYSRGINTIATPQTFTTVTGKKSFNAALDRGTYNDFSDYTTSPVLFLSKRISKIVRRQEFVPLYFNVVGSISSFQVRYYIRFEDGTTNGTTEGNTSTYSTGESVTEVNKNLYTYMFRVDNFVSAVEAAYGKTAQAFGITICSNFSNTKITEEKEFIIDNKRYEFALPVIYQNTLGGYDSFTFVGEAELDVVVTRNSYINSALLDYRIGDRYRALDNVDFLPAKKINSGWISKVQFDQLQEIVKSRNVYSLEEYTNINDYDYTSCVLLEAPSGTSWTNGTSGCARSVTLDSSPTTSTKLYVYSGYFPTGTAAFQAVNNFILRIGQIKSTSFNGATDLGTLTVRFGRGTISSMQEVYLTERRSLSSEFQYIYIPYFEDRAVTRLELYVEAINFGDDYIVTQFASNGGIYLEMLDRQFKYLNITDQQYNYRDGDDKYQVILTATDTIKSTNIS